MLTGYEIADRIEQLMAETPRTSKTGIGELLIQQKTSSPQAKRKRYDSLLKRLREEKIIGELRIVAEYLGVSVKEVVFASENCIEWVASENLKDPHHE